MSAIRFWTKKKGNLPHLSYILLKMYPMGTEFNTVACYITGALILIEFQKGKECIKHSNYQQELGATEECTKIMMKKRG